MLGVLIAIVILVPAGLIVLLVATAAIKARPDQEAHPPAPGHWMGIGIGIGIPIGLFLGLVMGIAVENVPIGVALGPAMGVGIGAGIGAALEANHKDEMRPLTDDEQRERSLVTLLAGVILLVGVLVLAAVFALR
ncbi:MAG: hypothetical protein JSV33_03185 [bacterium]|nr:MAG: hypothetical protein JSV33_03185 [bacterium]